MAASFAALLDRKPDLDTLAKTLDDRSPADLRREIERLDRAHLLQLWHLAQDADPIEFDHFVPPEAGDRPVIHAGRNSIPIFPAYRRFEKHFARMSADSPTLVGFNECAARPLIGPGYFVFRRSDSDLQRERGAAYVDYLSLPDGPVPAGWPPVVPNEKGFQKFVYSGTQDFMRRVSSHVSIGMPFKGQRQLPFPFVLVRQTNAT